MLTSTHGISTVVRLGAFMVFFFTCFTYFVPWRYIEPPPLQIPTIQVTNLTEASSTFNASVVDFWQHLSVALLDAKPQCKPLKVNDEFIQQPEDRFESLKLDKKHPERLAGFTDQDETALLRAHYKMRRSALHFAPKLSYSKETTGIVTTTDLENMSVLLVSLRMLRRTGCTLPVEVFLDDWSQYSRSTCDIVLSSLNARCIILSNILNNTAKPDHYQYKSLSILFSSFQNVLYLDTDVFPTYDPTILFTTPPFTTHGLITWPDLFGPVVSEHFYHIAGMPVEPMSSRLSTDSGQIMLNKAIHRESLLMMIYYNHYGPSYFYPLLSQGSRGPPDKETFVHAALATGLPRYQVRSAPALLGRWWNGTFRATGLAQADPGMDFEYLPPFRSHIHGSEHWENIDLAHLDPVMEKELNYTRHAPRPPRPVFLHQNILKMDPAKLLLDKEEITFEPDGTPHRMWGLKEDIVRLVGYDVEERLWGAVVEEGCREDRGSEGCRRLLEWSREVLGWMESIDRPW